MRHCERLAEIFHPIREELEEVESRLQDLVNSKFEPINSIIKHTLSAGGKRIRPALLLLSSRVVGYRGKKHIPLAAVVELIHTTALIHDDVIDDAKMRRGQITINEKWGDKIAVLSGDLLYSKTISLLVEIGCKKALRELSQTVTQMCEGEIQSILNDFQEIREDEYFQIIHAKTASFFSACCCIGASLGTKDERVQALTEYGRNVGIAFQIKDDILDFTSTYKDLGKTTFMDIKKKSLTLPIIYTLKEMRREERIQIMKLFSEGRAEQIIQKLLQLMDENRAVEYALDVGKFYINKAKAHLSPLSNSKLHKSLMNLADYVLERES
jgi:octaprenyl-diphosphate synthase